MRSVDFATMRKAPYLGTPSPSRWAAVQWRCYAHSSIAPGPRFQRTRWWRRLGPTSRWRKARTSAVAYARWDRSGSKHAARTRYFRSPCL